MIELIIKLCLAHLLGDFMLQPEKWVKDKEKHKIRSKLLYCHIVIHAILLLLILQFNFKYWLGILLIVASHYIIDVAKTYLENKGYTKILFLADQLLHFLIIVLVVYIYTPYSISFDVIFSSEVLLFITFLIAITFATSVVVKKILSNWEIDYVSKNMGGKYIGIIERLLIFIFIIIDFWAGIGFLLAAKSVFRFGDLTKNREYDLTEYILAGTLVSFASAIILGLLYLHVRTLL